MQKIFLTTNGCQRRELDTSKLTRYFKLNNCKIVKSPKKANYIIFSTCSFKKTQEDDSFKLIKHFKEFRGQLIITGCLPDIEPEKLDKNFNGKYISTKNLDEIDKIFPKFKTKFSEIPDQNFGVKKYKVPQSKIKALIIKTLNLGKPSPKKDPKIARLRISNGCTGNCAYCSARQARGSLVSKSLEQCKQEYRELLSKGQRDFFIVGDDVGAYGVDIKSSLPKLLEEYSKLDKEVNVRYSFQDFNPKWAIKYEKELISEIKKGKITDILCPFQSGSERLLKFMNRPTDLKKLKKVLIKFKKANPKFKFFFGVYPAACCENFKLVV